MDLTLFYGNSLQANKTKIIMPREDKAVRVSAGGITFDDLKDWPFDYVELKNKHDRAMFSFWEYVQPEDVTDPDGLCFRGDEVFTKATADNATRTQAIVLDVDGSKDKSAIRMSQMVQKIVGYNFMLYTSYSHTKNEEAYRVIIPLKESVSKQDWYDRKKALEELFTGCDRTCFDVSRTFYLPTNKPGQKPVFRFINDREDFDFYSLAKNDEIKNSGPVIVKRKKASYNNDVITQEDINRVLTNLKTQKIRHEPTWLKIAGAMVVLGCSESDFIEVTMCVMDSKTHQDALQKWRYAQKKSHTFFTKQSAIGTLVNITKGFNHVRK